VCGANIDSATLAKRLSEGLAPASGN
jgi:hypothetical protein